MAALTTDLTEVEADFSRVAAEASRTGEPVIVLKSNEPWVIPQFAKNLRKRRVPFAAKKRVSACSWACAGHPGVHYCECTLIERRESAHFSALEADYAQDDQ